ncbi:LytR/AlgR family response regulator transcription factor [Lacinutrix jangbogonensis]|uniref:LytR/AlgR family response regulator transcription factor n=1 Tax=Lacinutrix jangbogonensis TaxID=1469557 RepID=UPI00053D18E9|nr:LytTR family DNA-binding domain-containing protein [Lacinutrix jangbogonensis]
MKVVLIEDELASSRRLQRMLNAFNYEVVASLVSVKSAIRWFQKNDHPNLLFLDIHLADGLCFEIFKEVKITSPIVFTTAFSEYSIKAFDYNSVSYLLKPINNNELEKAIQKANTFYKSEKELIELKEVIENENIQVYKTEFAVRIGKRIKIIKTDTIDCFYSEDNATFLRSESSNYITNDSLSNLEAKLNPKQFFKANRKFIINREAIVNVISYSNSRFKIELKNDDEAEIILSRERSRDFKVWFVT